MSYLAQIGYWVSHTLSNGYRSGWDYCSQLDRHQWLVLLVVTTAGGFLCMRGYGKRTP